MHYVVFTPDALKYLAAAVEGGASVLSFDAARQTVRGKDNKVYEVTPSLLEKAGNALEFAYAQAVKLVIEQGEQGEQGELGAKRLKEVPIEGSPDAVPWTASDLQEFPKEFRSTTPPCLFGGVAAASSAGKPGQLINVNLYAMQARTLEAHALAAFAFVAADQLHLAGGDAPGILFTVVS